MNDVVFFNMFRNGDLFIVREFVRDIINLYPQYEWHFAHGNHRQSLIDMPCNYISIPHYPDVCLSNNCKAHEVSEFMLNFSPLSPIEIIRRPTQNSPLFINTWTGIYHGKFFPIGSYPNMHEMIDIWNHVGESIQKFFGRKFVFKKNVIDYFPAIDKNKFDLHNVYDFLQRKEIKNFRKIILWANGNAMSNQSRLQTMNNALVTIAKTHPDVAIIATSKFKRTMDNLFYTDDIFNVDFDLPLISVLSSYCDVIIGRNSGPYTYANTKENIIDRQKTFISFSNQKRDNLLYNVNAGCSFVHSDTSDEKYATKIIHDIIRNT